MYTVRSNYSCTKDTTLLHNIGLRSKLEVSVFQLAHDVDVVPVVTAARLDAVEGPESDSGAGQATIE